MCRRALPLRLPRSTSRPPATPFLARSTVSTDDLYGELKTNGKETSTFLHEFRNRTTRSLSVGFIGVDEPLSFVPRQRRHAATICFGQSPRDPVFDGLRGRPEGDTAAIQTHEQLTSDLAGRATHNDHSTQRGGPRNSHTDQPHFAKIESFPTQVPKTADVSPVDGTIA